MMIDCYILNNNISYNFSDIIQKLHQFFKLSRNNIAPNFNNTFSTSKISEVK